MNILVLCTGNSARSILAEVLLNSMSNDQIMAYSAGSKPVGAVNPFAIALLEEKGYSTNKLRSKSWDEFSHKDAAIMDVVITVCGNAADEVCPVWPGAPVRVHWGFKDPAYIKDDQESKLAFEVTYKAIKNRIEQFLALPIHDLEAKALQNAMQKLST